MAGKLTPNASNKKKSVIDELLNGKAKSVAQTTKAAAQTPKATVQTPTSTAESAQRGEKKTNADRLLTSGQKTTAKSTMPERQWNNNRDVLIRDARAIQQTGYRDPVNNRLNLIADWNALQRSNEYTGNDLKLKGNQQLQNEKILADLKFRTAQKQEEDYKNRTDEEKKAQEQGILDAQKYQGALGRLSMDGIPVMKSRGKDQFYYAAQSADERNSPDEWWKARPDDYWDGNNRYDYDQILYDSIHGEGAYDNIFMSDDTTDEEYDALEKELDNLWDSLETGKIGEQYQEAQAEYATKVRNNRGDYGSASYQRMMNKLDAEMKNREEIERLEANAPEGDWAYDPDAIKTNDVRNARIGRHAGKAASRTYQTTVVNGDRLDQIYYKANNPVIDRDISMSGKYYNLDTAQFMSPKQVETFNAYFLSGDRESAQAYYDALEPYLQSMKMYSKDVYETEMSQNEYAPWMIGKRILTQPAAGIMGTAGAVAAAFGNEEAADPDNELFYGMTRSNQNIQNARAQVWGKQFQDWFGDTELANNVGQWFNGIVYSMADNLVARGIGMGVGGALGMGETSKLAGNLIQFVMSSEATASEMYTNMKDGMDPSEAVIRAFGSGAIEWITEKYSTDRFFENFGNGNLAKQVVANFFPEAQEEGTGKVMETLLDEILSPIYGHESEFRQKVQEYDKEYGEGNGFGRALLEYCGELGSEMLAGGVSGGVMGGVGGVHANILNHNADVKLGKAAVQSGTVDVKSAEDTRENMATEATNEFKLLEAAEKLDPGSEARQIAKDIREGFKKGGKVDYAKFGQMVRAIMNESNEQIGNIAQTELGEVLKTQLLNAGEKEADAIELSQILMTGIVQGMSPEMYLAIHDNKNAMALWHEYRVSDAAQAVQEKIKPLQEAQKSVMDLMTEPQESGITPDSVSGMMAGAQAATPEDIAEADAAGKRTGNALEVIADGMYGEITGFATKNVQGEDGKNHTVVTVQIGEGDAAREVDISAVKGLSDGAAQVLQVIGADRGQVIGNETAKALLNVVQSTKDTAATVADAMKTMWAAAMQQKAPKTNLDKAAQDTITEAIQKDMDAAEEQRVQNWRKITPGRGRAVYNGFTYGTKQFNDAISKLGNTARNEANVIGNYAKSMGVEVELYYDEEDSARQGAFYGGQDGAGIRINLAGTINQQGAHRSAVATFAHEVTHNIEANSPTAYKALRTFVLQNMQKSGKNLQAELQHIMDNYEAHGESIDLNGAIAELVAMGSEQVLTSEEVAAQLKQQDPSLFGKVRKAVTRLINQIRGIKGDVLTTSSRYARAMQNVGDQMAKIWLAAYEEAKNAEAPEAGKNTTKLSIQTNDSGVKYVSIDTEQDIFDNASIKEYPRIVEKYITNRYRGTIIGTTNRAYVDKRAAQEYAHPAYHGMNNTIYEAKSRAATELDNLMDVAVFDRHENDDGRHEEAVGGWDYYKATIYAPTLNKYYEGTISIEKVAKGDRFHDFTKLKDVTSAMQGHNAPLAPGNASNRSIAQAKNQRKSQSSFSDDMDQQYADAVAREDWKTEEDMLLEKMQQTEGITGYRAPYFYAGEHKDIARLIKSGNKEIINSIVEDMAKHVPDNAVLVPMPPHEGKVTDSTDTMILAKALSKATGAPVINALESDYHESRYKAKAAGNRNVNAETMGFRQVKEIPEGMMPVFIDNMVGGGQTAMAAKNANGRGITLAYAQSSRAKSQGVKVVSVTYDQDGNLIPLSQRMDPNNKSWKYSIQNDEDYMDAVNSDDMAAAQRMVDEAAKAAGYTLKVYHGTPTGGFTVFRDWSYYTENKEYAERYNHASASSIRGSYETTTPQTYELYMNPGKVFDTREAKERKLFEEARMEYGLTGLENMKRGLPDWTDGRDIIEFLEDRGLDYDTILLDEGGDGGYGQEVVDRGISYVSKSNRVKSAEAVTYDDNGNIILPSERFNDQKKDIRWSMQDDTDYMAAVNSGDMAAAQRMVDEKAKEAGYTELRYHGTLDYFNVFDINKGLFGGSGFGFYFGSELVADRYSDWPSSGKKGRVIKAYLNTSNIATDNDHNITPDMVRKAMEQLKLTPEETYLAWPSAFGNSVEEFVERHGDREIMYLLEKWGWFGGVREKYYSQYEGLDPIFEPQEIIDIMHETFGYDGIRNDFETVVWDNKLIKSADPVTYDDDGSVIPLSERFDTKKQDIRWSMQDDTDYDVKAWMETVPEWSLRTEAEKALLRNYGSLRRKGQMDGLRMEKIDAEIRRLEGMQGKSATSEGTPVTTVTVDDVLKDNGIVQDGAMLKKGGVIIGSLRLGVLNIYDKYKDIRRAMENSGAFEYDEKTASWTTKAQNIHADQERDVQKRLADLRVRKESLQKTMDETNAQLAKITGDEGFGAMMYRQQKVLNDLVYNKTQAEVRESVEKMEQATKRIQGVIDENRKKAEELAGSDIVKQFRQMLGTTTADQTAADLKKEFSSTWTKKQIREYLDPIILKMKTGEDFTQDVEMLAGILVNSDSRNRYEELEALRGLTITLGKGAQAELKAQNSSLKEIRARLAGTGITVKYGDRSTLEADIEDLRAEYPMIPELGGEKDALQNFVSWVEGMKNQSAGNEFYDQRIAEAMAMITGKAAGAAKGIYMPNDPKAQRQVLAMMDFVKGLNAETQQALDALQQVADEMGAMQKAGREAGGKTDVLMRDVNVALDYYNRISRIAVDEAKQKNTSAVIEQLKSEQAQKIIKNNEEWRKLIQRDADARKQLDENRKAAAQINTSLRRMYNLLKGPKGTKNIPEYMQGLAREVLGIFARNDADGGRRFLNATKDGLAEMQRLLTAWEKQDGPFNPADLSAAEEAVTINLLQDLDIIREGITAINTPVKGKNKLDTLQQRGITLGNIRDAVSEIYGAIRAEQEVQIGNRRVAVEDAAYKVAAATNGMNYREWTGKMGGAIRVLHKAIISGNMTPEYFFRTIGNEGLSDLWDAYHWAENRNGLELAKAQARLGEIAKQHGFDQWDMGQTIKLPLEGGETEVTLGQLMSLWATWKREKTLGPAMSEHLTKGGFFAEKDTRDGLLGRTTIERRAHRVTEEDMAKVRDLLSDEQRKFVDDVVLFMSRDMSELGNAASMAAYGIRMYKEKYYFPFQMWDGVKSRKSNDAGSAAAAQERAFHPSFSKSRQHGANNALVIGDFMQTATDHIAGMINYATMGLANETMQKVLNQQTAQGPYETKRNTRAILEEAYGKEAMQYLSELQLQLNGGAVRVDKSFYDGLISLFRKNAVAGSLSVAMQQPMSYIRAAMLINPKYLAAAMNPATWKGSYQEMMAHSGVAVIKEMGRFDMNFGQSAREYLMPETTEGKLKRTWDFVTDKATILPEMMDRMTWTRMWSACKAEQKALHPEMDVKSDKFLDMVGERFNELMRRTQVYDSVLVKSKNMRSQNPGVKMITSFMAEPTLTVNVLADAARMAVKGEKGGKRMLAKAGATFILSAVMQAAIKGLFGAGRNPDKKKNEWENFLYRFWSNLIGEIDPLTLIPGYSTAIDLLKGSDISDNALGAVGKIFDATKTGIDALLGNKSRGAYRDIEDSIGQLAQLFSGLPLKNLMRDGRAMYNFVTGKIESASPYAWRQTSLAVTGNQFRDEFWTADNLIGVINKYLGEAGFDTSTNAYYKRVYQALKSGNDKEKADLVEYLLTGKGIKEEKSIWSKVTGVIKDEYGAEKIDRKEAEKLMKKVNPEIEDKDLLKALDKVDYEKEGGTAENYSNYTPLNEAIEKGDINAFKQAKQHLIKNGYEESDVNEQVRKTIKERYTKGKTSKAQLETELKQYAGITDKNELWWTVDRIQYQMDTKADKAPAGNSYYYRLTDAINKNSAEDIRKSVNDLLNHGISKDKVKSKLSDWKSEYLAADSNRRRQIRDALQKAYRAIGYTAEDADKTIKNWEKSNKKKK